MLEYQCLDPFFSFDANDDPCAIVNLGEDKQVSWLKEKKDDYRRISEQEATMDFDLSRYAEGSPLQLLRKAAASLPVPATVMNDRIRQYVPGEEDLYLTLEDGRYVNRLYSGVKLRDFEQQKVLEFRSWLSENSL